MRAWRATAIALAVGAVVLAVGGGPAVAAPGPPAYPEYWFDQWGVNALWAQGADGRGITVAVVDTGVSTDPPELSGHVLSGVDLTGDGGDGRTDHDEDEFSHGTAMASIIVAQGGPVVVGVAPGARILPVAVPLAKTIAQVHSDRTATAIDYAVDHGAKVINMSFGGLRRESIDAQACPSDVQTSVFRALSRGAILVASAGNSGERGNPVEDPSVCVGVVAVAAVDANDQRASFSSQHRYNTVAAPGVNVVSVARRAGDYFVGSGTSQASALTSGALALIWSAHPTETNRQVLARLTAGLRPAGPAGRDTSFGYGIVDAGASVRARVTSSSSNPVWTAAAPYLAQLATPNGPALRPPAAAPTRNVSTRADRDGPPGPLTARSWQGVGLAGLGVLLLAALLLGSRLTRQRARSARRSEVMPAPTLTWQPDAPPRDPPPGWFPPGP